MSKFLIRKITFVDIDPEAGLMDLQQNSHPSYVVRNSLKSRQNTV